MREKFDFFPSSVYRNELPGWVKDTGQLAEKYFQNLENGAWVIQTEQMLNNPGLEFLKKYFLKESIDILSIQGYKTGSYNFFVKEMWGQKFVGKGYNLPHCHPGSQISGFYFFEVPKKIEEVDFFIHDPRNGKVMNDMIVNREANTLYSSPTLRLNSVREGTFIMFNSWMLHNIICNISEGCLKFIHFTMGCNVNEFAI